MKRDLFVAAIFWLALTVVGEAVAQIDIFPLAASHEATTVDSAFRLLLLLGIPVFTLVLAVLFYSVLRFRSRGSPEDDGPPIYGRGIVPKLWFAITTALAITVMIHPGLTGLAELRASEANDADLVVKVDSARWAWVFTYPQYGVTSVQELVLPVDKRVRFEITSLDVVHSFWIPAFRMKIDAVPGLTTTLTLTPTAIGSFQDDHNLRVQCAELCGLRHAMMQVPVRVVEQTEFAAWLAQHQPTQSR